MTVINWFSKRGIFITMDNMLGNISTSSTLLCALGGALQKSYTVKNPLQNTTTHIMHFGYKKNVSG